MLVLVPVTGSRRVSLLKHVICPLTASLIAAMKRLRQSLVLLSLPSPLPLFLLLRFVVLPPMPTLLTHLRHEMSSAGLSPS